MVIIAKQITGNNNRDDSRNSNNNFIEDNSSYDNSGNNLGEKGNTDKVVDTNSNSKKEIIPYTGKYDTIIGIIAIISVLILAIYFYRKYRYLKKI